jgi:hypothetical protein
VTTAYDIYFGALSRLGLNFDDGLLGSTNSAGVLSVLNDGLAELSVDHDWLFSYVEEEMAVSSGIDAYDPPTDWLRTGWLVEKSTNTELKVRQRREHFGMTAGMPRYFDTSGDRILVAPVPDQNYVLRHGYFTSIPRIVRDSTTWPTFYDQLQAVTLVLPAPYDTLATLYVAKNIALLQKDRELYGMIDSDLGAFRRKIEDNRRRSQAVPAIKVRPDGF